MTRSSKATARLLFALLPLVGLSCAGFQAENERYQQRQHELELARINAAQGGGAPATQQLSAPQRQPTQVHQPTHFQPAQPVIESATGTLYFTFDSNTPDEQAQVAITHNVTTGYIEMVTPVCVLSGQASANGYPPMLQGHDGSRSYTLTVTGSNGAYSWGTFIIADPRGTETGDWVAQ